MKLMSRTANERRREEDADSTMLVHGVMRNDQSS